MPKIVGIWRFLGFSDTTPVKYFAFFCTDSNSAQFYRTATPMDKKVWQAQLQPPHKEKNLFYDIKFSSRKTFFNVFRFYSNEIPHSFAGSFQLSSNIQKSHPDCCKNSDNNIPDHSTGKYIYISCRNIEKGVFLGFLYITPIKSFALLLFYFQSTQPRKVIN